MNLSHLFLFMIFGLTDLIDALYSSRWSWVYIPLIGIGFVVIILFWRWFQKQVKRETTFHNLQKQLMDAYRLLKVLILQGQSPYQAMQTILPYIESNLAEFFQGLLMDIDQDKSIQPYLNFARQFKSIMAEQLLFSLYQLENQGGDGRQLQQFQYLFDQLEHQFYQQELLKFHEKMQQQNHSVMIATALIAITLLFGVMQLIGGMLYGI